MMTPEVRLKEIEDFLDEKISDLHLSDAIDVCRFLIENTQIKLESMEAESEDLTDED